MGERRFKKPVACKAWTEIKDCREFGRISVQNHPIHAMLYMTRAQNVATFVSLMGTGQFPTKNTNPARPWPIPAKDMGEDCLFLNIETPSLT